MAGSGIFGDFWKIRKLKAQFESGNGALAASLLAMRDTVDSLYDEGFDAKRSPFGASWAERTSRPGSRGELMVETGSTRDARVSMQLGYHRVSIVSTTYARYHQFGKRKPRATMPFEEKSLWEPQIFDAVDDAIMDHFGLR